MRVVPILAITCALCLLLGGCIAGKVFAQEETNSKLVPKRILLTWSGDPSTQASVTWRTDIESGGTFGQILKASAHPSDYENVNKISGTTVSKLDPGNGSTVHYQRVTFTNLEPETKYSYRVGNGTTWSEWIDFTTASKSAMPFKFVYFGDAQNSVKSMWSRVIRQSHKNLPDADFMLHAGDLINIPNADHEWEEWFYAGGWIHSSIPTIATPGNHEYSRGTLSKFWQPQFDFPNNGVSGIEETNYYLDFQGAKIISLNTNEKVDEQTAWLEKTLANNRQKWIIITFHHPIYSTAQGRDNPEIRDAWKPLFEKYKVDLVLQGHDHTYGRMNIPTGTNKEEAGVVYVVSVSGPKMYKVGDDAKDRMSMTGENTQLYQIISVNGNHLQFESRTATGDLHDVFTLDKQPDGSNRIASG